MGESTLAAAAKQFADELTQTLRGVLGDEAPRFVAVRSPKSTKRGRLTRVVVRTAHNKPIQLKINGSEALQLTTDFRCQWDHRQTYLAVHKASWAVRPVNVGEPLFRYEFEAGMNNRLPCAHLHVHAHRDEFVFQLFRAEKGRPKSRAAAVHGSKDRALPRLSNLHFPLGGPRMRPALEDVLEFLIEEFHIDTAQDAQEVLNQGRAVWRRRQIGAAVRDAPEEAARVLRELDYEVTPPARGPAGERWDKLTAL